MPKIEKHFTEYEELSRQVLFDEKPMGKLKILLPNGELKWEAFFELWGLVNARYHEASS